MGFLVIRLIEARGLEAKDSSGTSDPCVTFKLLGSDGQSVAKTKSKVVKKSCNPQFHETLSVTLPSENIKGYQLVVLVRDWNRIAKSQGLGEVSFPIEDLKPLQEKDCKLSLQNSLTGATIHFMITLHNDRRNNVLVCYENDGPVEYSLMRTVKLSTQIDLLCQMFKAFGSYESYNLHLESADITLTEEKLQDPAFEIPLNAKLRLKLKPNLQVQQVLEGLVQLPVEKQKKVLYDLKGFLQDIQFVRSFSEQNGVSVISQLIATSSGNTEAYALSVLELCLNSGYGWDDVKPQLVDKLVEALHFSNINVAKEALKICCHLAGAKNHGYPLLIAAIRKGNDAVYASVIEKGFGCTDVSVKTQCLDFFRQMYSSTKDEEKTGLLQQWSKLGFSKALRDLSVQSLPEVKAALTLFVRTKFELDAEPKAFDKENKEHEKMLYDLWNYIFPDIKLEGRISEQWKWLGFQGTDPATDFRAMGILAVKHLNYFAKNYTEILRNMMEEEQEKGDEGQMNYYPVATAGINMTKLMLDIFSDDDNFGKYLELLLDHDFALEEVYCTSLQFFHRIFNEGNSNYMQFATVISSVSEQLLNTLKVCNRIEQFKEKCQVAKVAEKIKEEKNKKGMKGIFHPFKKSNKNSGTKRQVGVIHENVRTGNIKKVSELLKSGVSVNELNENLQTPLMVAVLSSNLDMVRLLLWKDADVDIKNDAGWTALHEAAKNSTLEIFDALLDKGANPSSATAEGMTVLHYLSSRKFEDEKLHLQLLGELLERGLDVNHNKGANQETPLQYAVARGQVTAVKYLLEKGASVNLVNKRGYTALHMAVLQGQKDMVQLLLENGADSSIACREGTVSELARNSPQILQLLTQVQHQTKTQMYTTSPLSGSTGAPAPALGGPIPAKKATLGGVGKVALPAFTGPITLKKSSSNPTAPNVTPGPAPGKFVLPSKQVIPNANPGTTGPGPMQPPVPKPTQQESTASSIYGAYNPKNPSVDVPGYHGNISRENAEQLLISFAKDSFLLRTSSMRGCFALSVFRTNPGEITHFLVFPRTGGGFSIQESEDPNTYPTLSDLIMKSPLVKGCVPITNPNGNKPPVVNAKVLHDMEAIKTQLSVLSSLVQVSQNDLYNENKWNITKPALKAALQQLNSLL